MKKKKEEDLTLKEANESEEQVMHQELVVEEGSEEVVSAEETLTVQLEDLNQKFLRVAADFENYKRRTNLERDDLLKYSNAKLVGELLPIVDNFQLALKNSSEQSEVQGFMKGMEMIYNQFMDILTQSGMSKIEAVGQPFDPNLHEAIMQVADDSVADDTVIEELRTGYKYKDKVLRASMVKVSTKN